MVAGGVGGEVAEDAGEGFSEGRDGGEDDGGAGGGGYGEDVMGDKMVRIKLGMCLRRCLVMLWWVTFEARDVAGVLTTMLLWNACSPHSSYSFATQICIRRSNSGQRKRGNTRSPLKPPFTLTLSSPSE